MIKRKPSPAQLRARAAFTKMVKERARLARLKKKNPSIKSAVSRIKRGAKKIVRVVKRKRVAAVGYSKTQRGRKRVAPVGYRKTQHGRKTNPKGQHLPGLPAKYQRMYEDILQGAIASGKYRGREKEVAARTVWKAYEKANPSRGLKRSERRAAKAYRDIEFHWEGSPALTKWREEDKRLTRAKIRGLGRAFVKEVKRNPRRSVASRQRKFYEKQKARRAESTARSQARTRTRIRQSRFRGFGVRVTNPSNVKKVYREFRGKESTRLLAPQRAATGTPSRLAAVGGLRELKLRGKLLRFGGSARLGADGRKKLHIVGVRFKTRRPNPHHEHDMGEVLSVCYRADKPHIDGGQVTDYVHRFGEEGGTRPHLIIDSEGYPRLEGGSYDIRSDGIID